MFQNMVSKIKDVTLNINFYEMSLGHVDMRALEFHKN